MDTVQKNDRFKIYVDQLHDGHVERVDESFDSAFLDTNEPDLQFKGPVSVKGDVYVAGNELVLHLAMSVLSIVPCTICNTPVEVEILLPNLYEVIPLTDIPHGIFFMQETLRQAILLESKTFAECNGGKCPQRKEITPYLNRPSSASPFEQLQKDDFES